MSSSDPNVRHHPSCITLRAPTKALKSALERLGLTQSTIGELSERDDDTAEVVLPPGSCQTSAAITGMLSGWGISLCA